MKVQERFCVSSILSAICGHIRHQEMSQVRVLVVYCSTGTTDCRFKIQIALLTVNTEHRVKVIGWYAYHYLEANLITHQAPSPPYNVLLKDDSSFP